MSTIEREQAPAHQNGAESWRTDGLLDIHPVTVWGPGDTRGGAYEAGVAVKEHSWGLQGINCVPTSKEVFPNIWVQLEPMYLDELIYPPYISQRQHLSNPGIQSAASTQYNKSKEVSERVWLSQIWMRKFAGI